LKLRVSDILAQQHQHTEPPDCTKQLPYSIKAWQIIEAWQSSRRRSRSFDEATQTSQGNRETRNGI